MTREEKIAAIVAAVNASTDIPVLGEQTEQRIVEFVANRTLVHLPDRALDAILNVTDGLSRNEIGMLTDVLTSFINKAVDVPWLPEQVEEVAIRQIVSLILSKAEQGLSIIQK